LLGGKGPPRRVAGNTRALRAKERGTYAFHWFRIEGVETVKRNLSRVARNV
jgi:hypothetical protein